MWQCLTQRDLVLNLKIRAGNSGSLLHIMTSVYIFSESICKQSIRVLFSLPIAPTNCYHQPPARQFWNKWNSNLFYASFLLLPLLQQMSSGSRHKTPFKLSMWIYHLGLCIVFLTKKKQNNNSSLFLISWTISHLYALTLNRKKIILFLLLFSATMGPQLPLMVVRALVSLHFSSPFHSPLSPFCKVNWHFQSSAPFQNDNF